MLGRIRKFEDHVLQCVSLLPSIFLAVDDPQHFAVVENVQHLYGSLRCFVIKKRKLFFAKFKLEYAKACKVVFFGTAQMLTICMSTFWWCLIITCAIAKTKHDGIETN